MSFLGILATPLGFVVEWIYHLIPNYGWTLILFTLFARVLLFPLMLKQQKSTVRMAAYQPMINEINEKWKDNKERQQEEMMKFQQESGFSMTAGCLPMILNMLVMFGIIEVVYRPMQYVMRISKDVIAQAVEAANTAFSLNLNASNAMVQNELINVVKQNPDTFRDIFGDKLSTITQFDFTFFGIDLSQTPGAAGWFTIGIIIPILSVVTMLLMQIITQKTSGQQMQGSMKMMPWVMSLSFCFISFTVPIGFSLYYATGNVLSVIQSLIMKKIYDPEKIKKEVADEMEAKKKEKKVKKKVTVKTQDGKEVVKNVSQSEMDRLRLAKARERAKNLYDED